MPAVGVKGCGRGGASSRHGIFLALKGSPRGGGGEVVGGVGGRVGGIEGTGRRRWWEGWWERWLTMVNQSHAVAR